MVLCAIITHIDGLLGIPMPDTFFYGRNSTYYVFYFCNSLNIIKYEYEIKAIERERKRLNHISNRIILFY